jgi:hypothetical protein
MTGVSVVWHQKIYLVRGQDDVIHGAKEKRVDVAISKNHKVQAGAIHCDVDDRVTSVISENHLINR